jgi:hypothetical protein
MLNEPAGQAVRSWSFQARRPLSVVQTVPGNQITDVPLDAGIELTFSHDGVTGVEDHVTISPAVEGRWEMRKRTAVFVPEALEPNTLYTVTAAPGLGVEGAGPDGALAEPYTIRFETGSGTADPADRPDTLGFARSIWEAPTAAAPVLAMYGWSPDMEAFRPGPVDFTVYRYYGPEDFVAALDASLEVPSWSSYGRSAYQADTAGLAEVARFEAQPQPVGQTSDLVVSFPEALPAGYYLVEAS